VRHVLVLAAGVEDHEDVVIARAEHEVVDDATLLVGEHGELRDARLSGSNVCDADRLEERNALLASDLDLAHVGDVKEAGAVADVRVRLVETVGVLDGESVATEGNDLAAGRGVDVEEGGLLALGERDLGTEAAHGGGQKGAEHGSAADRSASEHGGT